MNIKIIYYVIKALINYLNLNLNKQQLSLKVIQLYKKFLKTSNNHNKFRFQELQWSDNMYKLQINKDKIQ